MAVDIVPINYRSPAHRWALVSLLDSYADTPQGSGTGMTDEARQNVSAMLEATPNACVLMAVDGDAPVGTAVCCQTFSTFSARPVLNLHDLVIAADRRGLGIGRRLMEAVEAEARRRGCCYMTLEVVADNEQAKSLYRGCGFLGGDSANPPGAMLFWKKPLN